MSPRRPVWALIPAKGFRAGKSRLAPVLDDDARAAFARGLLEGVLDAVRACPQVDGVLVATDGDEVAEVALARGAEVRRDEARGLPLARIVDDALADLERRGARAGLVLMADLPRLTSEDVAQLLDALASNDVVAVADLRGRHSNALALAPPTAIATRFGSGDSFAEHLAAARAAGLRVAVIENERVAFDVDGPADHQRL